MDDMENWKFISANKIFEKMKNLYPDDLVIQLYAWRNFTYIQDPPPSNWDWVNNLTEK